MTEKPDTAAMIAEARKDRCHCTNLNLKRISCRYRDDEPSSWCLGCLYRRLATALESAEQRAREAEQQVQTVEQGYRHVTAQAEIRAEHAEADLAAMRQERDKGGTNPRCSLCGGPHPFDTTVPSAVWNAVIRAQGLPDYLCLTCIVCAFVKRRLSFTCELIGQAIETTALEIRIGGQVADDAVKISEENTALRARLTLSADEQEVRQELSRQLSAGWSPDWVDVHRLLAILDRITKE